MAGKGDSMRPTDMKAYRDFHDRAFVTKQVPEEVEENGEDEQTD